MSRPNQNKNKQFWSYISGIITGASDNDPSGIVSYSLSGARFGLSQIWLMILAAPMLIAVQSMCMRLSIFTKKGLMSLIKTKYGVITAVILSVLVLIVNTATIIADITAITEIVSHYSGFNVFFVSLMTSTTITLFLIFTSFKKIEKALLVLVFFYISYIITGLIVSQNIGQILHFIIPTFKQLLSSDYILSAIAIIGTTITPFLFFWQSEEDIEEVSNKEINVKQISKKIDWVNAPGFIFSQIITIAIIATSAIAFSSNPLTALPNSPFEFAKSLEPLTGSYSVLLFSFGIITSGLLAVPILAACNGYIVKELFNLKSSLNSKFTSAKIFYITIIISIFIPIIVTFFKTNTISLLFYSQVMAGIISPIIILFIFLLSNNKKLLKDNTSNAFENIFTIIVLLIMFASIISLLLK